LTDPLAVPPGDDRRPLDRDPGADPAEPEDDEPEGDEPDDGVAGDDEPDDGVARSPGDPAGSTSQGPPGTSMFSLEGRSAPALYLIGWLGSLMGIALLAVWVMAAGPEAGPGLGLLGTGALVLLAIGLVAAAGSQAIERSRRRDGAYRGPSPVLSFAAVIALTLVAVIVVMAPLAALGLDLASPLAALISMVLTTLVYFGVVRLLVVGTGALSWRDMGLALSPGRALLDLVYGAVWAIPVILATGLLAAVLSLFLATPPAVLPPAPDALGIVANVLTAVVLAPIGEELFFRGFATTAWARTIGRNPAIVRGAIFFAVAHIVTVAAGTFQEGLEQAIFASIVRIPVGLALGWLFLARRSLPAAIGLHAGFNGLGVIALYAAS
jgi:uncharacterized protein